MDFIISLIISVILSIASTLLQQAFAQKPENRTGTRGTADIGGKIPQYFLMGTIGEAGKREYRNTWGSIGDTPNAYVVDVISFGDLPISDMTGAFVNGTRIELVSTGGNEQGYPAAEFNGKFRWKFYDGNQTTADSYLVSKFGSDADRPWGSNKVGYGIPYVATTAVWDEKIWTKFPEFIGEFQGIPLYDPRYDDTAGGTGDQRWDDQATWVFSDNSIVMIYNILRGIYYDGDRVWGGSCTEAQLPYDSWADAMDACDEDVDLSEGGTEKRFRAGRRVNLNERPGDIITELLIGCNGRISHATDGTVYVLVGVPDAAAGSFTDLEVLATESLGAIPFPNLDSIINGGTATYLEPSQSWGDKETAPYVRTDLESEDDGRQQLQGLDLQTTFSGTQAQRVLKAVIEEGRRFRTHVVALPPEYARFHVLEVLAWTSDRFDYSGKLFLITARTVTPWGSVVFGLQEVDPEDHDWDPEVDENVIEFAPIVTTRPPPQPMTGWQVFPATILDNDGEDRRPSIEVRFASGLQDVQGVRVQVRLAGETDTLFDGEIPYETDASITSVILNGVFLPNTNYEVRGKYVPVSGRETSWSDWLDVTTPNVLLGPADVDVILDGIEELITEQFAWMTSGFRSALEAFKNIGSIIEAQELSNYHQREQLSREINVRLGNVEAGFTEVIEVALGPGGSIATALSVLYAAMGGNTAEVLVRWEAVTAPEGVSARWALQLSVTGEDEDFDSAGIYLEVTSLGVSRIILDAAQTLITTDGGTNVEAMFDEDGAIIRDLTVGTIRSVDGLSFWNTSTGAFRIAIPDP